MPGGDAHHTRPRGSRTGLVSFLQKQRQGSHAAPPPQLRVGQRRALPARGAYPRPRAWSQTSSTVVNKTSASVSSNHSLLLQVAMGTREFLAEKKHERKVRSVPGSGLLVSGVAPALRLLLWLCCRDGAAAHRPPAPQPPALGHDSLHK